MNYAKGIATARERASLSKRQLAIRSGVDPSYITHLEAGRREPSIALLKRMADVCGVSLLVVHLLSVEKHELDQVRAWLFECRYVLEPVNSGTRVVGRGVVNGVPVVAEVSPGCGYGETKAETEREEQCDRGTSGQE